MRRLTEHQFWLKANKAFEHPSYESASHSGVCRFAAEFYANKMITHATLKRIQAKASSAAERSACRIAMPSGSFFICKYGPGVEQLARLRFIRRMIRQTAVKS